MLKKLLRIIVVLVLPYFGLDMITPELPGAFAFNCDQTVEVVHEDLTLIVSPAPAESRLTAESETLLQLTRTAPLDSASSAPCPERRVPLRAARSALARDSAGAVEAD